MSYGTNDDISLARYLRSNASHVDTTISIYTDPTANMLGIVGKLFIALSFVMVIFGFVASGNSFGTVNRYGSIEFNVMAAIIGGFVSGVTTCIPGLLLLGFSKLILYAQQASAYAKGTYESARDESAQTLGKLDEVLSIIRPSVQPKMEPDAPADEASAPENAQPKPENEKAHLIKCKDTGCWLCSECGRKQREDRSVCFACGVRFQRDAQEASPEE